MKLNHYRISKTKFQRDLKNIEKVKNLRKQAVLKIYIKEYGITYRWMKEAEDREMEEKLGLT